jgi:putative toxin-antitoxin system antitoxin component (TIGR02293 family)
MSEDNVTISVLNEAIATYASSFRKKDGLRRGITYGDFLNDRMFIIQAIQAGIPFHLFHLIKTESPFNDEEWADFLNISLKSLQRYKISKNFRFKPIHSEKILEVAEVIHLGKSVFNDAEKLLFWFNSPSYALGGMKPADLVRNSYGKEMVVGELHRIDHGIFA